MKEQDFIQRIEEQTKDLTIPESVSPKAIKDLLDNATQYKENSNEVSTNNSSVSNRRLMKRLTLAACLVLCFAGSIYASRLISVHNDKKQEPDINTTEMTDTNEEDKELVYQTNLKSPASYDEYYKTLKDAYDKYYDSISDVRTFNGREEIIMEESVSVDGALQDSAVNRTEGAANKENFAEGISSSKGFSSTNTQEATVDEGDVIKTDGTYIYKLMTGYNTETGRTSRKLSITKAVDGKLTAMSNISLDDVLNPNENENIEIHEFYLHENSLYLMFSKGDYSNPSLPERKTCIVVYDLADKKNPKKVKTLSQSGWYESSRISDGYLYTISNFCETSLEDKQKLNQYIPTINDNPIACDHIYYPPNILMDTTHVVTTLNLNTPEDFTDTKAIPSSGNNFYVSDSSIYFYTTLYDNVTKTEIMKIDYTDGKLTVGNSAVVAGYLYDNFALNENDGYLRVVATIPENNVSLFRNLGTVFEASEDVSDTTVVTENVNALYILDKNMKLTGKITGIAPGETIQSARFMGDIGYFVTFRNMDPLFSVDLSDPKNPEIIGSLKIPGFSNYLHFYSDNLMLGLGQEVDPVTQEWLGLKLSMFDISDPANVTEQDKYIIENSEMSDALYNHKAIMIDPKKNIFGFAYGANTNKKYYSIKYYYATYTYNKEEGFVETAKYRINDDEYDYDSIRGIYIGDYFYLTTNRSITSYKIGSEQSISTVTYKGA